MFDLEYWRWRIEKNPSEHEIYRRHVTYYLKKFELDPETLLCCGEKERFAYLLRKRGCSQELINDLLDGEMPEGINFDVLYSRLELGYGTMVLKSMQCVNSFLDGRVHSKFSVNLEDIAEFLRFYPFSDIGAKAKINGIWIDGHCILQEREIEYYPKGSGYTACNSCLHPGTHVINVEWEYMFV